MRRCFLNAASYHLLHTAVAYRLPAAATRPLFLSNSSSRPPSADEKFIGPTAKYSVNISDTLLAEIKAAADAPLEEVCLSMELL